MTEVVGGIAYERVGEGPPLLLVHGLGATREIWRPQIERLSRERDVISVDMPGFGESPDLPADVAATPANIATAVRDTLAALGIERAHWVGESSGGIVAPLG